MPSADGVVLTLMADTVVQSVFKEIARNRSVLLKDIRESLGRNHDAASAGERAKAEPVANAAIENAVRILKDASLIREREAPIEDFNTYYVTADGLSAERKLRIAEATAIHVDL